MNNKKIRFSVDVYWSVGAWVAMSLLLLADRWFAFLPAEADWVYVCCMSLGLLTVFDVYRCHKAARKGGCRIAAVVDLPWALGLLASVLWLSVSAQISALRQIEVAGLLDTVCFVLNLWFVFGLLGKRKYATGNGDATAVDAFEYTLPADAGITALTMAPEISTLSARISAERGRPSFVGDAVKTKEAPCTPGTFSIRPESERVSFKEPWPESVKCTATGG